MVTKNQPRISPIVEDKASPEVKKMYTDVEKKLGMVPNLFRNLGNSSAVLKAYLSLDEALTKTSLSPKLREEIILAVSQVNQCNYCLAAHTQISKMMKVPEQEILMARKGDAHAPKTKAILHFAKTVAEKKGKVSHEDIMALKSAGVSEQELVEIYLAIFVGMFTNYFNNITDPEVDFPAAPAL